MTRTPPSTPDDAPAAGTARRRPRPLLLPLNALRGFLIGLAELVPGVSGGTVALVTGVYEQLIASASHVLGAGRQLLKPAEGATRGAGFRAELARTDWWLILPVMAGMATAVLTVAGAIEGLVTANPEHARGLMLGLVAASLLVPIRLMPRRHRGGPARAAAELLLAVGAAALSFWLVGLGGGGTVSEPSRLLVLLAAAVAICALVVPGVSGSFFLLAIGLYSPTLQAVDQRDLGYIAVFAAGAAIGLASIVQVLRHLLTHHRRITLIVMTGLMAGSLRALWPWQAEGGEEGAGALLAPQAPVAGPVLLAVAGAVAVLVLVAVEARLQIATHLVIHDSTKAPRE